MSNTNEISFVPILIAENDVMCFRIITFKFLFKELLKDLKIREKVGCTWWKYSTTFSCQNCIWLDKNKLGPLWLILLLTIPSQMVKKKGNKTDMTMV